MTGGIIDLEDAELTTTRNCLRSGGSVQLRKHVRDMAFDRVETDDELRRDRPIARAAGDEVEHLNLAGG